MLVIGLTGTIASGKSTVASMIRAEKIPVIDVDDISHFVTQKDFESLTKIKELFGESFFLKNGKLDRKRLRHLVFNDKNELEKLEKILHPKIIKIAKENLKKLEREKIPLAVLVSPLLFEKDHHIQLARTLLIVAREEIIIKRLQNRDQISYEEALKIIKLQMKEEKKILLASEVLENNGDLNKLAKNLKIAWYNLTKTLILN